MWQCSSFCLYSPGREREEVYLKSNGHNHTYRECMKENYKQLTYVYVAGIDVI